MFDDDFQLVVVMDWELTSLGTPIMDLGWWLFFDDVHSETFPRLPGLGNRQDTIERWEQGTGLSADGVEWYEILAGNSPRHTRDPVDALDGRHRTARLDPVHEARVRPTRVERTAEGLTALWCESCSAQWRRAAQAPVNATEDGGAARAPNRRATTRFASDNVGKPQGHWLSRFPLHQC